MLKYAAILQHLAWDDLRFVLAVERFGSNAEAARRLEVDEATVSRRVAGSEHVLGTQLFERMPGKLIPTEAGRAVARRAEDVEREIGALISAISGRDHLAARPVRVTAVPAIVNRILIRALPALLKRYPDLHVELIADPRDFSLTRREADIALRLARPRRELRVIARRVGYMGYAVYGPKDQRREQLSWITYDDLMADLPQARWMADQIKHDGTVRAAVRINDAERLIRAVEEGLGKSLLPTMFADPVPGLARLSEPVPALAREV
jgi:DNA-binding transcriptional LysR family regulator